jgi:TonB family protein
VKARRRSRTPVAAVLTLSVAVQAAAQAPRWAAIDDTFVKPARTVAPRLPARDRGGSGGVEYPAEFGLKGRVGLDGELRNPRFDHPGVDKRIVEAVSRVLHHWRFRPALNLERCAPMASEVSMRVSVDEVDGKAGVLVAIEEGARAAASSRVADPPSASHPTAPRLLSAPRALFPEGAFLARAEGEAELAVRVDPEGGAAAASTVLAMPLPEFGEAALEAIARARFDPPPAGQTPACALLRLRFCLAGTPEHPLSACDAARK